MSESINKKIIDEIDKSEYDSTLKEFLKKILSLEFKHFEEEQWRFRRDYESKIKHYAKKFKVECDEY